MQALQNFFFLSSQTDCDFSLLTDVNEPKVMVILRYEDPYVNIRNLFARSHLSKEKNRA